MVKQQDRNPAKMPPENMRKVLDDLNKKVQEAEAKAKSLNCDAPKFRRQAEEILREKCPNLGFLV